MEWYVSAFSHIISTKSCSCFSGSWICTVHSGSAAVAVCVSIILRCTIAWERHCLQLLQPWKCRLVSLHVKTYLAILSLSLSFVMKRKADPWALFTDASEESYTKFCFYSCFWSCSWFTDKSSCLRLGAVSRTAAN